MLQFNYKVQLATKKRPSELIWWDVIWNGNHDEAWYKADEHTPHPFARTIEFESNFDLWKRYNEVMKRQRKAKVALPGSLGRVWMTRKDIAEMNPENMREYGCVCAMNPVTLAMCEMLIKPEEIRNHSGMTDPYWYWMTVLGCLSRVWD